ncbi:MAG: hypothetical protein L3J83_01035 [Proteobacteria bacterium]|nr:hypothetical protein [Pseudomonadota bacterium]
MKNPLVLITILWIAFQSPETIAKKKVDFSHSKVAILVDVKDEFELVRLGPTIFANFQGGKQDLNYKTPELVHSYLTYIFNKLDIEYEFVKREKLNKDTIKDLKPKALIKLKKQNHKIFINNLKQNNFTDLLSFIDFFQPLKENSGFAGLPFIKGYGIYRVAAGHCIYHTIGYLHTSLKSNKKPKSFSLKRTIPERKKLFNLCRFGKNVLADGIKWQKNILDYSKSERIIIKKSIEDLILESMIHSFHRHGIIDTQLKANRLYLEMSLNNFVVIEKLEKDKFTINDHVYDTKQITELLKNMSADSKNVKVLIGYKSKSKFNFGDLKHIFIPPVKGSMVQLYRLGFQYEIIGI